MAWPLRLFSATGPLVVVATVALAWLACWQVGRRLPAPDGTSAMRADG
jgi:cytochrome oxidase assembly protein ShyY1